jgi:hypothetical protein
MSLLKTLFRIGLFKMIFPQLPRRIALFCGTQQALWRLQIEGQLPNIYKTCQGASLITSQCMRSFSHIHQVSNTTMSNVSWSTMMLNSTQSCSNTTSASMSSAGGVPPVPNPIEGPPRDGAIGPTAALEQHAATLSQCAIQIASVARDAAADAADNKQCSCHYCCPTPQDVFSACFLASI